jgi:GNAT superfamily N-acetyltransferase
VDKLQVIELYDLDQRINVKYPDTRREDIPNIVRHVGLREASSSTILYSRLDNDNVDQTICEQIDYFEGIGQDFEWKVFDYDSPADLKDRLVTYGFEIEESEAIMVFDLNATPDFLLQPVAHDVRQITSTAKIADVMSVERQVWNEDFSDLETYLTNTLASEPEKMSIYTAYADDQPVSSAWVYFPPHSQFASLWGGSTLAEFRGQGLYSALLAVRVQEAISRKVSYLTVDASPMSRPILEKFGFEKIADSFPCSWKCRSEK